MRKYNFIFPLLLLLLFQTSCKSDKNYDTDLDDLKSSIEKFYTALNNGNTEERLALFAPDAIIMPNNAELIHYSDSVKAILISYGNEWIFRIRDLEHVEIDLSRDIAYTVNTYYYTFHKKDSEPDWRKTKNVHIWRKQPDGSWKLHLDIWNSSVSNL